MLVDGQRDIPGAAETLGDGDEIAGTEIDGGLVGSLAVGLHLPSQEVACLLRIKLERELAWRTTPPTYIHTHTHMYTEDHKFKEKKIKKHEYYVFSTSNVNMNFI